MNLITINEPKKKRVDDIVPCIGIDFGTTNSVCSIKKKEKIICIEDDLKYKLIPSIVLYEKNKKYVGNKALNKKSFLSSVFSVKRFFTKNPDEKIFINENDQRVSAIEVSKEIFMHLKENCDKFLKQKIYDCVLTVPAYYDEKARSGIMKSAFMAGFNVKRLINEPTAAAFAYGLQKKKRGNFFVFDLGGGTFDVSILKLSDGIFKVIGSGGDPNLGGDDFDELFANSILKKYFQMSIQDLSNNEKVAIIKKCRSFKEDLIDKDEFNSQLTVKKIMKDISIKTSMLNESIDDLVNKTIDISSDLLNECELDVNEIDGFILVGGSTRLRCVNEKIKEKFHTQIFNDVDPDLVVSHGAALHGYELLNGSQNLLLDVTPLSLGIETMGGLMERIIARNTSIPVIKEQTFTTHENGQTSIKITILQGERDTSENNRCLGEFILSGLEPKPAGIPRIKVSFSLDVDGILFVSAVDESSGKQSNLVIKTSDSLDVAEMRAIVESSIANAKSDVNQRMIIESKIKATKFLNEIASVRNELNLLCSKKEIEKINRMINMLKKELNSNDVDKINHLIDQLNESTKQFAEKRIDKSFSSLVGEEIGGV